MSWVENFEEVSNNYQLFDKVLQELTKPVTTLTELKQSKTLKPNWKRLPPDVVNLILDILEKYNIEFYTNLHIRIDTITNTSILTTHHDGWTSMERKWYRFIGTPPVDVNNKYVTTEMVLHTQSLPFSIKYIVKELEKRNLMSLDGNIKPSKMKCKYIKNIVQHTFMAATSQMYYGWQVENGGSHNIGNKTIKDHQKRLDYIKSRQ